MVEGADSGPARGVDSDRSGGGRLGSAGIALRLALAVGALAVGLVWVVRLGFEGPAPSDGLLFELLGPLLLFYLGGRYLTAQIERLKARRADVRE